MKPTFMSAGNLFLRVKYYSTPSKGTVYFGHTTESVWILLIQQQA